MKQLIIILLLLVSQKLVAQSTAFLYRDSVVQAATGYKQNEAQLDSLQGVYSKEVKGMREDLDKRLNALVMLYKPAEGESLEQLKTRMNETDLQKLALLQEEDKLIELRIQTYNTNLQQFYTSNIKPIIDTIDATIAAYAKKNKIDVVFIMEELSKSMAYYNKGKNITATVIRQVNESLKQTPN